MKKAKFRNCDDRSYEIRDTIVRITLNVGGGEYVYKEVGLFEGQSIINHLYERCADMREFELDDTWYNE